uniref:Uncharacterized protein n=1 Tax=Arundo donax TaxID=35708 RepID=A0A0A9G920_ARUDO
MLVHLLPPVALHRDVRHLRRPLVDGSIRCRLLTLLLLLHRSSAAAAAASFLLIARAQPAAPRPSSTHGGSLGTAGAALTKRRHRRRGSTTSTAGAVHALLPRLEDAEEVLGVRHVPEPAVVADHQLAQAVRH